MEVIQIPNIANYSQEIVEGVLVLTPKKLNMTEDELYKLCLGKSKIMGCKVSKQDAIISNKTKYLSILKDIWKSMPTQKYSKPQALI